VEAAALKFIRDMAIEAAGANRLWDQEPGQKPAIIIDGKIVDTEHLLPGRVRFRGHFGTPSPKAFADYVNKAGETQDSRVYVDPEAAKAVAYINEGTTGVPGHCDWTASLTLKATAGYAALLAINGKRSTQRELSDWIEDWAPMLASVFADGVSSLSRAINAIRSITIKAKDEASHIIHDMGARKSGLSQVEAASEAGDLPVGIEARVIPFNGLELRTISLRLSVITGEKPALVLRIVGLEALQESIAEEFRDLVQGTVTVPVVVGTFRP
jgi:uncharacterized protein YfdQ (DUF2303 family)